MNLHETLPETLVSPQSELDQYVQAFELALSYDGQTELTAFLPEPGHPLRREVMRELIRVDLEFAWRNGRKKRLEEYAASCAEVFHDPASLLQPADNF